MKIAWLGMPGGHQTLKPGLYTSRDLLFSDARRHRADRPPTVQARPNAMTRASHASRRAMLIILLLIEAEWSENTARQDQIPLGTIPWLQFPDVSTARRRVQISTNNLLFPAGIERVAFSLCCSA